MTYSFGHILKRSYSQARQYKRHLVIVFLLSLLASPIALLKPFALKILIDSGFGNEPIPDFLMWFFPAGTQLTFIQVVFLSVMLVIVVALIANIHIVTTWILNTVLGEKLVLNLKTTLFNHIQRLSLSYHDSTGTADTLYRLQWDSSAIRTFLIGNISPLLSSILVLTGLIVVMFTINTYFALITFCLIPPLILLTRISTNRLRKDWKKVKQDESNAMSVVQEALSSLRVVKAFGQENSEDEKFSSQADKALSGQVQVVKVSATFYFITSLLFAGVTGLFIYLGAGLVKEGKITLGDLTLVLAYLSQILSPLEKISKNLNDIQSSLTSLSRVYSLLDKEKEVNEDPHAQHLTRTSGYFEFKNVSFNYEDKKPTLKNISFRIEPGERVGVMGTTGAGKSTLISLLIRFYDPTEGKILFEGEDIRNFKLTDYRNLFAIVLQDPVLFSTSIEENIRYGRSGATENEITESAKAANAHEFIMRSNDGYKTQVGERGMQLSGGERQRISIARAFIKNAPMLILDEPTSSVDVRTESLIMDAMERLMEGRTTFLITHRLDTLKTCNVIVHLEGGRLINFSRDVSPGVIEQMKKNFTEII